MILRCIGHVDIEYCWYKMNARTKVAVPSKSVNECGLNNVPPIGGLVI